MKRYTIKRALVFGLLVLALLCSACSSTDPDTPTQTPVPDGQLQSFNYQFGSYNEGYWNYELTRKGDTVHFVAGGQNGVDLAIDTQVEAKVLDEIADIIEKENIGYWDGFNESDESVLDGHSFALDAQYSGGGSITASGYMKYPQNFDSGHQALAEYLEQLSAKASGQ